MALRKNYNSENGINVSGAYLKLETISGTKEGMGCFINVYVDRGKSKNPRNLIEQVSVHKFKPDLESSQNIFEQAYNHVKKDSRLADAEDVTILDDINYDIAEIETALENRDLPEDEKFVLLQKKQALSQRLEAQQK
jgi:hypothetical protein